MTSSAFGTCHEYEEAGNGIAFRAEDDLSRFLSAEGGVEALLNFPPFKSDAIQAFRKLAKGLDGPEQIELEALLDDGESLKKEDGQKIRRNRKAAERVFHLWKKIIALRNQSAEREPAKFEKVNADNYSQERVAETLEKLSGQKIKAPIPTHPFQNGQSFASVLRELPSFFPDMPEALRTLVDRFPAASRERLAPFIDAVKKSVGEPAHGEPADLA